MRVLLLLSVFFPLFSSSSWPLYILGVSWIYLTYYYAPAQVSESAPFSTFPPAKIAYYSCSQLAPHSLFCPTTKPTDSPFTQALACYCSNKDAFATMAYCFQEGHEHQVQGFLDMCNENVNTSLGMGDFESALKYYYSSNPLKVLEQESESWELESTNQESESTNQESESTNQESEMTNQELEEGLQELKEEVRELEERDQKNQKDRNNQNVQNDHDWQIDQRNLELEQTNSEIEKYSNDLNDQRVHNDSELGSRGSGLEETDVESSKVSKDIKYQDDSEIQRDLELQETISELEQRNPELDERVSKVSTVLKDLKDSGVEQGSMDLVQTNQQSQRVKNDQSEQNEENEENHSNGSETIQKYQRDQEIDQTNQESQKVKKVHDDSTESKDQEYHEYSNGSKDLAIKQASSELELTIQYIEERNLQSWKDQRNSKKTQGIDQREEAQSSNQKRKQIDSEKVQDLGKTDSERVSEPSKSKSMESRRRSKHQKDQDLKTVSKSLSSGLKCLDSESECSGPESKSESAVESLGPKRTPTHLGVSGPIRLNESQILLFRDSYDQFLGNYNRSITYGWYLSLFWALIFLTAGIGNWTKVLVPRVYKRMTGRWSRAWRSQVSLPALKGRDKTSETPFWGILDFLAPTRAEALILSAFSVLTVILCFLKIRFVEGGPFFKTKTQAFMRYYAVRSGTLASYLLPWSVLFAGRNNVLQWLTRWDYSVFVMFHRWISRWMVLLLVVHSIGYSRHLFKVQMIEEYVWCGVLGTASGLAILVQGLLVLRRKWYEVFLGLHIVLAAGFMVGAWFHVKDLRFLAFYYFSVSLWVADRLFRMQRLCQFGFPVAQVQLYEDDTLKVSVPIPRGFQVEGGGHCFVHFLRWSCFWQSHPFTYTVLGHKMVFYVKVKDGVTRSLAKYLYSHPTKAARIRVAVEGSYGEATPAHRYDSSVFVAGGNGIPGIYAEAVEVVDSLRSPRNDSRRNRGEENGRKEIGGRKVKLVWVVREYVSALWFYDELSMLSGLPIEVDVYITKPGKSVAGCTDKSRLLENTFTHKNYQSVKSTENQLHVKLPHVTFHHGRPNIQQLVDSEVELSPGSTCFVTCGHPIMVDQLRAEVVRVVGHSEKRVDYFEQLQVWA